MAPEQVVEGDILCLNDVYGRSFDEGEKADLLLSGDLGIVIVLQI
jgi:hypothetical protein